MLTHAQHITCTPHTPKAFKSINIMSIYLTHPYISHAHLNSCYHATDSIHDTHQMGEDEERKDTEREREEREREREKNLKNKTHNINNRNHI